MARADDERRLGLSDAAGRAALFPARAAARVWRDQLEVAADEVLSAPEVARVIDRALAGSLPEELARSLVRHRVLERVAGELASSGELERLLDAALANPRTLELTDRVLASDEAQHALRHLASSPELRNAVARQTSGLAEEVMGGVRASAMHLDDRATRRHRDGRSPYAGLATRAAALALDALATIAIYTSAVGVAAIVGSLVGGLRPEWLVGTLLAVGWALVAGSYFVLFWSAAGQTPGMRLLRLRVLRADGRPPTIGRSIVRLVGLGLAIVPLFAGFLPVVFDERRRGLADFLARTVVVYDPPRPVSEQVAAEATVSGSTSTGS
ncbi:MAG TPA: RDD family protein [Gaiellaceae bacterium]|nr:RDD family protein [Gaiellaceae bacterium]